MVMVSSRSSKMRLLKHQNMEIFQRYDGIETCQMSGLWALQERLSSPCPEAERLERGGVKRIAAFDIAAFQSAFKPCDSLGRCPVGEAVRDNITLSFALQAIVTNG